MGSWAQVAKWKIEPPVTRVEVSLSKIHLLPFFI